MSHTFESGSPCRKSRSVPQGGGHMFARAHVWRGHLRAHAEQSSSARPSDSDDDRHDTQQTAYGPAVSRTSAACPHLVEHTYGNDPGRCSTELVEPGSAR